VRGKGIVGHRLSKRGDVTSLVPVLRHGGAPRPTQPNLVDEAGRVHANSAPVEPTVAFFSARGLRPPQIYHPRSDEAAAERRPPGLSGRQRRLRRKARQRRRNHVIEEGT
jgi:hypothetical protein